MEEKITMLHSEHSKRLAHVEALLMKHFDDTEVVYSYSDMKKRALTMEAALIVSFMADA